MSYPTQIIKEGNNILFKTDAGVILKVMSANGTHAHPSSCHAEIIYFNNIPSAREEFQDIYPIDYTLITTPVPPMGGWTQELLLQKISDEYINQLGNLNNPLIVNEYNFEDFGSVGNIPQALNSVYEIDNSEGYNSIAFFITPPTGGVIKFEGTFDGINWMGLTLRNVGSNGYTQFAVIAGAFIGSISCVRKLRFRVSVVGSADGTVMGRITNDVSTIEGIEHSAAPHNIGYEIKHADFEFLAAQTNTPILTPTLGKKFVITDILFTSDGVNDITIFDETNAAGNIIVKIKTGQERFFNHPFRVPIKSAATNNSLKVTSNSNSDFRGTIIYYEID